MGIEEIVQGYFEKADSLCNEVRTITKKIKAEKSKDKREGMKSEAEDPFENIEKEIGRIKRAIPKNY